MIAVAVLHKVSHVTAVEVKVWALNDAESKHSEATRPVIWASQTTNSQPLTLYIVKFTLFSLVQSVSRECLAECDKLLSDLLLQLLCIKISRNFWVKILEFF